MVHGFDVGVLLGYELIDRLSDGWLLRHPLDLLEDWYDVCFDGSLEGIIEGCEVVFFCL